MTATKQLQRLVRYVIVSAVALAVVLAVTRNAIAVQPSERDVVFRSGDIVLAGTLLVPASAGPHAGIVLVHGSGPGPRTEVRLLAERFVTLGLAALIYDKRGSGTSAGDWTTASLDDLADDALAAVSFLKAQPELDPKRVGIFGVSQGGWVIPRAAARQSDALAFAVVVTGGGLKPSDVERHDYGAALDALHVSQEQRRDGLQLVERYLAYLKDGRDRPGLEQAIAEARSQPWFRAVDVGRVLPTDAARAKWAWVPAYDPVADITEMRVPVLVLLGGRDRPSLSGEMQRRWRTALTSDPDASIIEVLNADHGMTVPGTHHIGGSAQSFVPGYLEMLDGWLRAHCRCS